MWRKSVLRDNVCRIAWQLIDLKKKSRSVHKFRLDNFAYKRNAKVTGCIKWSALHVKSQGSDSIPRHYKGQHDRNCTKCSNGARLSKLNTFEKGTFNVKRPENTSHRHCIYWIMYIIKYIVHKVLKQLFYRNLCKMHWTIYTLPEAKKWERKSELYFE